MKNKDIEKQLHTSLTENTPDVWEEISRRTVGEKAPAYECVPVLAEGEPSIPPSARGRGRWLTACLLVLALLLSAVLFYPCFARRSDPFAVGGSFFIDINPSIQITLTKEERVEDILPLNEDARVLLADADGAGLRGKTPAEAAAYIWQLAYETGYLSPDKQDNALLISSALDTEEHSKRFNADIQASLNAVIKQAGLYCAVLTETKNASVETEAQKYNVTSGKYQLLQRAIALGVDIDEEDFDDISISELNAKIVKRAKEAAEQDERIEEYRKRQQERKEQAKQKNDSYIKEEDFEERFEEWLEQFGKDFEEDWQNKREEWKENQRKEYDDDDDDDDDDDREEGWKYERD